MVNKTQFYKTKVALAVVLSLGLAACGDSDGDVSTATSQNTADASQPTEVKQQATGSIQGSVFDTNGHPVVGATVTTSGKTATTDASGSYLFDDVQVTNVAGADGAGDGEAGTAHLPFVIVIQAPEGYASTATVNVTPNAQVDAENQNTVGTPLTTFIDGFLAQAGTAIMPKKDSVIEGWIRNVDTGEATEGAFLSIDYTDLSPTVVEGGANVALSGDLKTTTTNAEGYYRFEGAYNDAVYQIAIQDHNFVGSTVTSDTVSDAAAVEAYVQGIAGSRTIATANKVKAGTTPTVTVNGVATTAFIILDGVITSNSAADIVAAGDYVTVSYTHVVTGTTTTSPSGTQYGSTPATTGEGVEINMGTQTVRMITSADTINPYVADVTGWIKSSIAGYAILNEGVNQTFTVIFSEPVNTATFNVADLLVTDSSSNILATTAESGVVLAADGRSVTVNLAEAQDPGTKISIFMPWQDATDVAGNFFSVTANDDMDIDFDSRQNATTGKASFLRVNLCVFLPAIINPTGYSAVQDFDHTVGTDAGSADLAVYSNAFLDDETTTGDTDVRQLNGDATDTDAFLTALGTLVAGNAITVETDHAAVIVDKGEASGYTFPGSAGTVTDKRVYFDNVAHGDTVKFTFLNDLALAAGDVTVTLVDQVKPTTILQENYELYNEPGYTSRVVSSSSVPTLGAGGEVTEVGVEATTGNPIIYVQPRHITPVDSTTNVAIRGEEWDDLVATMPSRLGTGEVGNLQTVTDGATPNPIYDDAAFAAWTARANSLGFAFSEDVSLTGTANIIFSGANNLIGNYSAIANVTNNIDNTANLVGKNDLVRAEVTDYLALANENNNTTVSFSGDVQDTAGNVADDNSRATVVLRDAFPPMATNVTWEGTTIKMVFNEPVAPVTGTVITVDDLDTTTVSPAVDITLNSTFTAPTAGAYTLSADGKTLTVSVVGTDINALMEDGQSNEFLYEEDGDTNEEEKHASIAWDNLNDANGNDWLTFDNDTDVAFARHEVNAPRFMMYDNVGTFTVGYSFFNLGAADTNFNISITFTHPIDVTDGNAFDVLADGDNDGTYFEDGATDINAVFCLDINGDTGVGLDGQFCTADDTGNGDDLQFTAGTTAALSGDRQRIDIVMPNGTSLAGPVTLGTTVIRANPTVDSGITGQTRSMNEIINN